MRPIVTLLALSLSLLVGCGAEPGTGPGEPGEDAAVVADASDAAVAREASVVCPTGQWVRDCDGDPRNLCETRTDSDPMNCGACGHRCTQPGLTSCAAGVCTP